MMMQIIPIPLFSDNYAYLVRSKADDLLSPSFLVDPADASAVLEALGGNEELLAAMPHLVVVGGRGDGVPGVTLEVGQDDTFSVGALSVLVLQTPCHTRGHVLYVVTDSSQPDLPAALFCGDTLFIGGCGRFFEGTADEMFDALCNKIASLPDNTRVFCGHEYTVSNLKFAAHVEPENQAVKDKLTWAEAQRAEGKFTIPSTVAEEKTFNPFMRVNDAAVKAFTQQEDPVKVMLAVREAKNTFKG